MPFSSSLFWGVRKLFSKQMITAPMNKDSFIRSFPTLSIFCLIALTSSSRQMWNSMVRTHRLSSSLLSGLLACKEGFQGRFMFRQDPFPQF